MRTLRAMVMAMAFVGCGGGDDDGSDDDGPIEGEMTYREVIEEYSQTICQRALDCECGGPIPDPEADTDACRGEWTEAYCDALDCRSVSDVTREQMDACKADSMVISCDEPAMPASCDPLFPYEIVLVCERLDSDDDGVADPDDNCIEAANPDQADGDDDGIGDACEEEG